MPPDGTVVPILSDRDIVAARQEGRRLAISIGLSPSDAVLIATAISELARNIVAYAQAGSIALEVVRSKDSVGLSVTASDTGPGIVDIEQAMRDGFSTSGSLGLGLPGVRRLMDDFDIRSTKGLGTTVRATKWRS